MMVEEHDTHVDDEPEQSGSDSVVAQQPSTAAANSNGKIKTKTVVVGEPLKVTVGRAGEFPEDLD